MLNKILITIQNSTDYQIYRDLGISNFAYPLENFAVGFDKYFKVSEMVENSYIIINKILDSDDVINLENLILEMKKQKIKGIIFSDVGVYEIFKKEKFDLIWNNIHFTINSQAINFFKDIYSSIISNDITSDEVKFILNNANKPLIINLLTHNMLSYSKRNFIKNYNRFYNKNLNNKTIIKDKITNRKMLVYDEENSTTIFSSNVVNNISLINEKNILFFFVNTFNIKQEFILDFLNCLKKGEFAKTQYLINNLDTGFLNEEMTYKIKGDIDD